MSVAAANEAVTTATAPLTKPPVLFPTVGFNIELWSALFIVDVFTQMSLRFCQEGSATFLDEFLVWLNFTRFRKPLGWIVRR